METITPDMASAARKMKDGAMELKSAVIEKGADTLEQCCDETESMIKANPYRSVLIAFGVGALVGMFVFRR